MMGIGMLAVAEEERAVDEVKASILIDHKTGTALRLRSLMLMLKRRE